MSRLEFWASILGEARATRWEDGLGREPTSSWSLVNVVEQRTGEPNQDFEADWRRAMTEILAEVTAARAPEAENCEVTQLLIDACIG